MHSILTNNEILNVKNLHIELCEEKSKFCKYITRNIEITIYFFDSEITIY